MPTNKETAWWEREGLAFQCRGCGHCCQGPGGHVWILPEDLDALIDAFGMTRDAFGKRYLRRIGNRLALIDNAKGDCIFLGPQGRCLVYHARPIQCSTFPWWPEVVRSPESWKREKRNCPGIGQGPIHAPTAIQTGIDKASAVD